MTRAAVVGSLVLTAFLAVTLGGLAWQAPQLPERPVPSPRPHVQQVKEQRSPALTIKISADRPPESLGVSRAEVDVVITGPVAQTTTILTFTNPHSRILEGELVFPLPEGAVVSGYGLDVDGELVDGVPVEKQAARVAFETEVRRGVDPGLVEWVQGNVFRTRVYPIPAGGVRTVKLQYLSDLPGHGSGRDRVASYHQALDFGGPLDDLALSVRVARGTGPPAVSGGDLPGLRFGRWGEGYLATASLQDVPPTAITITLPVAQGRTIAVEEAEDGEAYFVIDDVPPAAPPRGPARAARIGLFWDSSLSAARSHTPRERALLEAWLKRVGQAELVVVAFRDRPEPARTFTLPAGLPDALAFLGGLPQDGGTSLQALRFGSDCAYHVLFSDGLASLGEGLPAAGEAPVYTVSGATEANHLLLRELAERSGGAYFNLQQADDASVLDGIGAPVLSFLGAEAADGKVLELYPAGRRAVQGRFTLAGRLQAPEAHITARFGRPGEAAEARTYVVRRADAADTGGLVPRRWAAQKVVALSVFPERHHDELLATGRRFGLVTPGTSLLVLETLAQHLEHKVEPPRSRKALHAEYRRHTDTVALQTKRVRGDKLDRVARMWEEEVRWWETEFPRRQLQIAQPTPLPGASGEGVTGGVVAGLPDADVAAPPPPPPPPPDSALPARMAAPRVAEAVTSLGYGAPAVAKAVAGEEKEDGGRAPTVTIKAWDPGTPYLPALRRAGREGAYAAYLAQRDRYGNSPGFFLDCADHLFQQGQHDLAVRVLTSVVELQIEEPRLLRVAGHRLQQAGAVDLAIGLFDKVRRLRPEEPQSLRDLALALAARADARRQESGRVDADGTADYLRAIDLLNQIVLGEWDQRFPEVEVLALLEVNRIIAVLERAGARPADLPVDPRFVRLLDADVRIVLTWDTDATDMDLWVLEPTGEKCFYEHPLTTLGGRISSDFTGGYGPEEYMVRRARRGVYRVKANYYGTSSQGLAGPTTVQATVITGFGRPEERRRAVTLRLTGTQDVVDVGEVAFGR
jgi:Ca-activated chloride channel homolog